MRLHRRAQNITVVGIAGAGKPWGSRAVGAGV
jgi:hypothetical protein